MMTAPQIEPVSVLARDHKSVFAKLGAGPVWLALRSRPAAVLVSVEQWDQLVNRLEDLEDINDVLRAKLEFVQSREQLEEFDADEFPELADLQSDAVPSRQSATTTA